MKGGITGQKFKASVKKTKSEKAEVKMLELLESSPLETEIQYTLMYVADVVCYLYLMRIN